MYFDYEKSISIFEVELRTQIEEMKSKLMTMPERSAEEEKSEAYQNLENDRSLSLGKSMMSSNLVSRRKGNKSQRDDIMQDLIRNDEDSFIVSTMLTSKRIK